MDERYAKHSRAGEPWRVKGARFTRWLTSRPAESWGFFAAGFLICAILT